MYLLSKKMSRPRILLALCLLGVIMFSGGVQTYASKVDLVSVSPDKKSKDITVVLNQGTAEIIDIGGPVADVLVADPLIVNVVALQSSRLYVVGLSVGSTNLIVVDGNGDVVKRLNIHVTFDTGNLQRKIDEFFPDEDIKVQALRGQFILSGTVSTPDVAQKVQNLVTHHVVEVVGKSQTADEAVVNFLVVKGKSQVTLHVKIMEVSRTLLRQRGSRTNLNDLGGTVTSTPANIGKVFANVVDTGLQNGPFANFGLIKNLGFFGTLDTLIGLLEEEGLGRVLAEPNLTAISGEEANFLAGGEFPVPSGRDVQGNIQVVFKRFGVSLNFLPTVLSEKRISLQLQTEVSSLAENQNVQLGANTVVPGLNIRRASTTVELGSGGTLMIAGLLQSDTIRTLAGIPGMTKTPIIGQLMSSDRFRRDETELVILVTPYLVEPFADKKQAKEVPMPAREKNYLASAFSKNIRRTYGALDVSGLFDGNESYGYLLD